MLLGLGISLPTLALAAGLRGGGPATYLGQVATRSNIMTRRTGATSMRGRLRMTMREGVSTFQIVLPNWFVQDFVDANTTYAEAGPGGEMVVRAAVEYPEGVFTQVTFSGGVSFSIPNGGQAVSDPIAVPIPAGSDWFFRFYNTASAGMPFIGETNVPALVKTAAALGDFFEINIPTDNTMGGAYSTNGGIGNMYAPVAVIAQTTKRSFLLVGDSISAGERDAAAKDMGIIARSIGPSFAYSNFGVRGDSAFRFTTSGNNTKRMALAQYFSDIICQIGINDVGINGRTSAQATADLATMWSVLKATGKRLYQSTLTPSSTSSDSWITVANQGLKTWEANRLGVQNFIRAGNPNISAIVEIGDAMESARNSGKWKAPPQNTFDGTHPNAAGYLLPGVAGAVLSAVAI